MSFTFGCDPELVLYSPTRKLPKSAINVLPNEPNAFKDMYHDNVMAEFKVSPAECAEEIVENIREKLRELDVILKSEGLSMDCTAAAAYSIEEVKHPEANGITSQPVFTAYRDNSQKAFFYSKKNSWRYAGGHIHLGAPCLRTFADCVRAVRILDVLVGLPAVLINQDVFNAKFRAQKGLGYAGLFRRTSYGLEYRPLSNFWLGSPKLVELIWELFDFAIDFYDDGGYNLIWSDNVCKKYKISDLSKAFRTMNNTDIMNVYKDIAKAYVPKRLLQIIEAAHSSKKEYNIHKEWSL